MRCRSPKRAAVDCPLVDAIASTSARRRSLAPQSAGLSHVESASAAPPATIFFLFSRPALAHLPNQTHSSAAADCRSPQQDAQPQTHTHTPARARVCLPGQIVGCGPACGRGATHAPHACRSPFVCGCRALYGDAEGKGKRWHTQGAHIAEPHEGTRKGGGWGE